MSIEVLNPGLSTTVQDQGRFGYYHVGLPQGGSLDAYSSQAANMLVGNTADEAVLECTYMGASLRFDRETVIAVTGAVTTATIDGEEALFGRPWSFRLGECSNSVWSRTESDSILQSPVESMCRSFSDLGRPTPSASWAASRDGSSRPVMCCQSVNPPQVAQKHTVELFPQTCARSFRSSRTSGCSWGSMTSGSRRRESGTSSKRNEESTPVADRAGLRYEGPGVEWVEREQPFGAGSDPSNIVDAGYAVGSIQIPGGTQPIVLHRDAVSGGGYAMVATVISADMDKVARATPGTVTRFIEVTMDEALEARREYKDALAALWS